MKTDKGLTRDVLLQRLAQVPGIQAMTDDELRALYCEGLAGAFQRSIDAKDKEKIANNTLIAGDKDAVVVRENETADT